MINYPWLKKYYIKIINYYKNNIYYRSIYINTCKGIGTHKLIMNICNYILCKKKKKIISCGKCKNCNLFINKNSNDLYFFNLNYKKNLDVDNIRNLVNNFLYFNRIDHPKIIYIKNIEYLNNFSNSSLLKIVEEPPINTFFFFTSTNHNKVNKTLISRCIIEKIFPFNDKKYFLWLVNKTKLSKYKCYILLKLNNGSPLSSIKMIKKINWSERNILYNELYKNYKNNIILLINIILIHNINIKILFLYSIFLDTLKYKFKNFNLLINIDKKKIIKDISNYLSFKKIYKITYQFMICYYHIKNNNFINKKILIMKLLIECQKIIKY